MFNKTDLFNLTLNALLLTKKITNASTDQSTEASTLNTTFNAALFSSLEEMDLSSTTEEKVLELIQKDPNQKWAYAYKYPVRASFVRRIVSGFVKDNEETRIPYEVKMFNNEKVIFTNKADASVEFIDKEIPLTSLSTNAGLAVAHKHAWMCAPLLVGKNTKDLKAAIMETYIFYRDAAINHDYKENFQYESMEEQSPYVRVRQE